ncbi:uncharacterized protein LOC127615155 [Hippocampus zosterae]|uniref:uncharacterized protein LOC127615155 n=1 Tax=Hippocampus zosterae TaxID=109293 RepID=UPI00223D73E7|nr:uncharacterized protein LOC127615155 [Hippocampus zosterae]
MADGAKTATGPPAAATAAACGSVKSKAVMVLNKLRVSVELLVALAALLCWLTVGVVMFDFVEYKAVPDIQHIMSDPLQAAYDAADEVSNLASKFQECAPDLSDPMSAATYALDEIAQAKDKFVQHFSDENDVFYLSYVDPVPLGRGLFHSTNDFACGVAASLRDTFCAALDAVLHLSQGWSTTPKMIIAQDNTSMSFLMLMCKST